jgi:hypothetical protein
MFAQKPEVMLVFEDNSVCTVSGDDIGEVVTSRRKPKACIIFADRERRSGAMLKEITTVMQTVFPGIEIHLTDNGNNLPAEYRWLKKDGDKAVRRGL